MCFASSVFVPCTDPPLADKTNGENISLQCLSGPILFEMKLFLFFNTLEHSVSIWLN